MKRTKEREKYIDVKFSHVDDANIGRCQFCGLHESRWPFVIICLERKRVEEEQKKCTK